MKQEFRQYFDILWRQGDDEFRLIALKSKLVERVGPKALLHGLCLSPWPLLAELCSPRRTGSWGTAGLGKG